MQTREKLVLAILGLSLFLCWFSGQGTSPSMAPTPTRTMAEGIIELVKIYDTPTGRALMNNIMWFDFKDERWTATPTDSDWAWLVEFHYTLKGQRYSASWSYRVDLKQLTPLDYAGRFLFNNP